MSAKNFYHNTVKNALIKDSWNIKDDPLILSISKKKFICRFGI
ncbi:element excision factor XisH family protein [Trichodesmium erythraeum]|nr:hypothetical protein [Trichodesmium erythraeum GBRTRLIN201]